MQALTANLLGNLIAWFSGNASDASETSEALEAKK
jgi:hypothetical protein